MNVVTQEMEAEVSHIINSADSNQYLTFILGKEEYGIDILRVQEIKGWDAITTIPNTPEYIKGVINLRGTIVPIIDLREKLLLGNKSYGPTTVVIVLKVESEKGNRIVGIVVDAVSDVYSIGLNELKPAPDFGGAIGTEYVRGLATVEEKMVILLNIDELLNVGVLNAINSEVG